MQLGLIVLSAGITIFSLNLLIVSLLSYWKYRNKKLLLISSVFIFFFIRGLFLTYRVFYEDITNLSSILYLWVFDLFILVLLYITSLKR
jgi:hypothetical protein